MVLISWKELGQNNLYKLIRLIYHLMYKTSVLVTQSQDHFWSFELETKII